MDCRSTERRQWIIDNYNVVPDVHAQLLANQIKQNIVMQVLLLKMNITFFVQQIR